MSDSLGLCTWSSALARISELVPIEETARQFKAFLRARGIKSASDLLRLALVYASGNSLLGSSAWAKAGAIAEVSGPALYKRLGNCEQTCRRNASADQRGLEGSATARD